jgi:hypothetical protein
MPPWGDLERWLPRDADDRARESGTAHMRRSMQLDGLEALFDAVPADAPVAAYRDAVLSENVLGQPSASARLHSWKPLRSLYRLDPAHPPFAVLRRLWGLDRESHPRLALLAAVAHDPLLRSTVPRVLDAAAGREVTNPDLAGAVEDRWPGRFAASGLQKIGQYTGSTWRQGGYLDGDRRRLARRGPVPVPAAAYAFVLGALAGFSGAALLRSPWIALLELDSTQAEALAERASSVGLVDYRSMGGVVELGFAPLFGGRASVEAGLAP